MKWVLAILVCLNILAWLAVYNLSQPQFLEVTFFDVGQGDAIFIETPENHQILIDGGPNETILEKLGQEMPFWDRTIDLVLLTHPESDHMAGLIEVLKRYDVENVLWTGVLRDTGEFKEWQSLIANEGAQVKIAEAGKRINCSKADLNECYIDILFPFESFKGEEVKNPNNTSIIARLLFGETSFLFTGDAFKEVERELVKRSAEIDSDILKVGHHGSKTSTAKEFIELVSPETAVISVGKDNRYGHPYQEVIENLEGARVLRTDIEGDIKIISDGTSYKVDYLPMEFETF